MSDPCDSDADEQEISNMIVLSESNSSAGHNSFDRDFSYSESSTSIISDDIGFDKSAMLHRRRASPVTIDLSISPERPYSHINVQSSQVIPESDDENFDTREFSRSTLNSPITINESNSPKSGFSYTNSQSSQAIPEGDSKDLESLHKCLTSQTEEYTRVDDPKGLKVQLMPHQQQALCWLIWREQQKPAGGILGDDMGLGKTLSMISLILTDKRSDKDSDDEWENARKVSRVSGGTLVVCPASLLGQWETEIRMRCKRGMLRVNLYHGSSREKVPRQLAKYDVVITTYNILSNEFKSMAPIYRINWYRIILDEAHIIRNHKSQIAMSVCGVTASKRWAVTGTPIHNKEIDLYSFMKFLKCAPFDDLRLWKRWVDNKNAAGRQRLAMVMNSLMLRRTKEELQGNGNLITLPTKMIEEIIVELDPQEQQIYEEVLLYSRTLFAQFLAQKAEKEDMVDLDSGLYNKPYLPRNLSVNRHLVKARNIFLSSQHQDVKTHDILVLLLRLRQVCCHPSLIYAMFDQDTLSEADFMDKENLDSDLLTKLRNISLLDTNNREELIGNETETQLLMAENPVFATDRVSSKMKAVLSVTEKILAKGDKLVIVSQWTKMLDVIASHLCEIEGASFQKFTGSVPVKDREAIMVSFNAVNSDPKILLLSLTAGGVGLNLIGGNHLLLVDIHWNPQLELQAQDRVYRFGQKKDVYIYKFICKDTIEERVKHLQQMKLELADNVLNGARETNAQLTLNDLKSLFAM